VRWLEIPRRDIPGPRRRSARPDRRETTICGESTQSLSICVTPEIFACESRARTLQARQTANTKLPSSAARWLREE
jgi:hypothetical protein